MRKNDVYLIHGTDYLEMTKRLLFEAGLSDMIGDRGASVGIKPNLVAASAPSQGATTHGELVEGTIAYLREQGFSKITVMEGSWVGADTAHALRAAGYEPILKRYQVPFVDLQKDGFREYDASGMRIKVCDSALAVDFMINVPVLKGHCQTTVTCALKNNKGVIPNSEKRRFHTLGLHKPIAHLNTVVKNDFILVDNICGDLDFEEGGDPVPMDRILGFADPVLCDAFVCEAMGFAVSEVPYIGMAEALGGGLVRPGRCEAPCFECAGVCPVFWKTGQAGGEARPVCAGGGCLLWLSDSCLEPGGRGGPSGKTAVTVSHCHWAGLAGEGRGDRSRTVYRRMPPFLKGLPARGRGDCLISGGLLGQGVGRRRGLVWDSGDWEERDGGESKEEGEGKREGLFSA